MCARRISKRCFFFCYFYFILFNYFIFQYFCLFVCLFINLFGGGAVFCAFLKGCFCTCVFFFIVVVFFFFFFLFFCFSAEALTKFQNECFPQCPL